MKASTAGRVALAGLGPLVFLLFLEAAAAMGSTAVAVPAAVFFFEIVGVVDGLATGAREASAVDLAASFFFLCCDCLGVSDFSAGSGRGTAASAAAASSSFCFSSCCFRRTSTESTSGKRATAGSSRLKTTFPCTLPPSFSSLMAPWRAAMFCCRFSAFVE